MRRRRLMTATMPPGATLNLDWSQSPCFLVTTGPSFSDEQALGIQYAQWRGAKVIAINSAWKKLRQADVIYGCDDKWWKIDGPDPRKFKGLCVTARNSHLPGTLGVTRIDNVEGEGTWVRKPWAVTWNGSASFHACNLALHTGAPLIILVGFDGRYIDGKIHFFGHYPKGCGNPSLEHLEAVTKHFHMAAADWPEAAVRIRNGTPGSAITCFRSIDFLSTPLCAEP
jgi:hypothetical protein